MDRRDVTVSIVAIAIIIIAALLLSYGRRNEISSILMFGYVLDAVVTTGVVGNLVVFLLIKATKLSPFRIALWTFAVIHVLFVVLAGLVGGRDAGFALGNVVIGYAVSFLIWTGLHWAWRLTTPQPTTE